MAEQRPERPQRKGGNRPVAGNGGLRFGRGLFGWVLFVALAILLFMLLNKNTKSYTTIPLSEFWARLAPDKGDPDKSGSRFLEIEIGNEEISGRFANPEEIPNVGKITHFKSVINIGSSNDWAFIQAVMSRSGTAKVTIESNNSMLMM